MQRAGCREGGGGGGASQQRRRRRRRSHSIRRLAQSAGGEVQRWATLASRRPDIRRPSRLSKRTGGAGR
eukprot:6484698-Lingulodinium_polyedra.AAC.1